MNFKKKLLTFFLLLTLCPSLVFAYSDKIILGGDNIGINIHSKNVMIVGFYKVEDSYIGVDAGLKVGDLITKINNNNVSSIDEMISVINNDKDLGNIKITFLRDNKEMETTLTLKKDKNNIYKTGLYVKDQINGIGTLTYIDPNTKIFGALGHEIAEKSTLQKVEINGGTIFESEITGINKSENGTPGSKEAKFYSSNVNGMITKNEESGIFGIYTGDLSNDNAIEVAEPDDIKLGNAVIKTVIEGNRVDTFSIEIINIDINNPTKNILFEITDQELLSKTGGVVAGMSGSPIIQDNKIIGAVTHVVVNDTKKGYGIFITTMLKEGEK